MIDCNQYCVSQCHSGHATKVFVSVEDFSQFVVSDVFLSGILYSLYSRGAYVTKSHLVGFLMKGRSDYLEYIGNMVYYNVLPGVLS